MENMRADKKSVSVGIDLGTTYSSMSYAAIKVDNFFPSPVPQLATDPTGSRIEHQFIPSLVCAYLEDNQIKWTVGKDAEIKAIAFKNKAHLYRAFKLSLGAALPDKDQKVYLGDIPVVTDPGDLAKRLINYMKELAFNPGGTLEGYGISSITVSTPALWTEDRKLYVENIVRDVFPDTKVQSLEEPISALYSQISSANYLLKGPEKYVLVIDYGGGTCDVAVVKIKKDADRLQAKAKRVAEVIGRGSKDKGGRDIDWEIAKYLNKAFNKTGIQLSFDDLVREAELMKITFSYQIRDRRSVKSLPEQPSAALAYEAFRQSGKKKQVVKMLENKFAELLDEELNYIKEPIVKALNNASNISGKPISYKHIEHIFLAGGTTLLPLVKDKIESIFKEKKAPVSFSEPEPRFAIVYGNALHAYHTDTKTSSGIGLTLQESIWLKGAFGIGILIAKEGTSLPYRRKDYPFILGKRSEIEVGLYRGDHQFVEKNEEITDPIRLLLTEPVSRLLTRFKVDVLIRESGIIDFELIRIDQPKDSVKIQNRAPVRHDIEEMKARAGKNSFGEE